MDDGGSPPSPSQVSRQKPLVAPDRWLGAQCVSDNKLHAPYTVRAAKRTGATVVALAIRCPPPHPIKNESLNSGETLWSFNCFQGFLCIISWHQIRGILRRKINCQLSLSSIFQFSSHPTSDRPLVSLNGFFITNWGWTTEWPITSSGSSFLCGNVPVHCRDRGNHGHSGGG